MYTSRKPYYQLKNSITDFFSNPTRFIRESLVKESAFEKPYLDMEYPQMHLNLSRSKYEPIKRRQFAPPTGGFGMINSLILGIAKISYGEATCKWEIARIDDCISGPVIITVAAEYFWSTEFNFAAWISSSTIGGVTLQQLEGKEAGHWDEQDFQLTFPSNANGTVVVCANASGANLISETFKVIAGFPITLQRSFNSGIQLLSKVAVDETGYRKEVGERIAVEYGGIGAECGCIELTSKCSCNCSVEYIYYTAQQMPVSTSQTLSVMNPVEDCAYTWSITGGGSLSELTGISTIYTAPDSNPNCELNPIITLSTDGDVCDTLFIAINAVNSYQAYLSKTTCSVIRSGGICKCMCGLLWPFADNRYEIYMCDGTYYGQDSSYSCTGSEYPCEPEEAEVPCVTGACPQYLDIRSYSAKLAGCCPAELL